MDGSATYAAWANYKLGCVVAVPYASSRQEVVRRAKQWIDARIDILPALLYETARDS
ncbi:MAG: hypothetical protein F6K24_31410 [Okeania sp. SIO2D1]|nr:hypothetical protein [Okeania sp. SIO2D1]